MKETCQACGAVVSDFLVLGMVEGGERGPCALVCMRCGPNFLAATAAVLDMDLRNEQVSSSERPS